VYTDSEAGRQSGIELADFTDRNKWVTQPLLDQDAHVVPVRLAAALFDLGLPPAGASPCRPVPRGSRFRQNVTLKPVNFMIATRLENRA
jgi:hypothetical protein